MVKNHRTESIPTVSTECRLQINQEQLSILTKLRTQNEPSARHHGYGELSRSHVKPQLQSWISQSAPNAVLTPPVVEKLVHLGVNLWMLIDDRSYMMV